MRPTTQTFTDARENVYKIQQHIPEITKKIKKKPNPRIRQIAHTCVLLPTNQATNIINLKPKFCTFAFTRHFPYFCTCFLTTTTNTNQPASHRHTTKFLVQNFGLTRKHTHLRSHARLLNPYKNCTFAFTRHCPYLLTTKIPATAHTHPTFLFDKQERDPSSCLPNHQPRTNQNDKNTFTRHCPYFCTCLLQKHYTTPTKKDFCLTRKKKKTKQLRGAFTQHCPYFCTSFFCSTTNHPPPQPTKIFCPQFCTTIYILPQPPPPNS